MEKFKKCHYCFCFTIFFSSVLLFFLFYLNSNALTESENVLLMPDEHVIIDFQNQNQQQPVVNEEKKSTPISRPQPARVTTTRIGPDPCLGKYIYVHDLPRQFNDDMLKECASLSLWTDMCKFLSNEGLGPQIRNGEGAFSKTGWFATNQFALDIIFNNRMKRYKCLTRNSSLASAIFVPFFAGLDVSRYLWGANTTMRDFHSLELVKWLVRKPEWQAFGGRDHFLVGGRIAWDFRRYTEEDSGWGNKLLLLPEVKNMTALVIESSPWSSHDFGIPYPTYFHPSKDREVSQWQRKIKGQKRRWLFSFAGAPRPENALSIRGEIIKQCLASRRAKLLECHMRGNRCYSPSSLMKLFQRSVFCLQPQGDSYTRRSSFDSILAGCIPVFFHPGSAYTQYTWHLPLNHTSYSVFISENDIRDGKVSIEKTLLKIPKARVKAMREKVIGLIPRIIYADPRSRLDTFEDAFDIAVKGVLERVSRVKKDIREGRIFSDFEEDNSWKYALKGDGGEHEWDSFFYKPISSDTLEKKRANTQ